MIYSTVSFRVAPGKNLEANEYFHTVVRQVKKITGAELRILNQLGGPVGHYTLLATYDNVADWDQARQKLQSDLPFQKLVAQAGADSLFLPGQVQSEIWQQIQ